MTVLRGDLLNGRAVALAPGVPDAVAEALSGLGARLERLEELAEPGEERVGTWARGHEPLDVLVCDARVWFAAGGLQDLSRAMQNVWAAIREVALGALIDADRPSKIVLVGPPPDAGTHAEAVRSALENLARTLSVEWARYSITAVVVAPGSRCAEHELATLVCFLCSGAGEYFSGCRLELEGAGPGRPS